MLVVLVLGCSKAPSGAPASPARQTSSTALTEMASEFASQGQSDRAEQYYLAALEAEADPDLVYPLLIETCVGRLGSAKVHVEHHLRDRPDDPQLLWLSAALNEALGDEEVARERIRRLETLGELSPEIQLFLALHFVRTGDRARAYEYYAHYLRDTPISERKPWVESAQQRLSQRSSPEEPAAPAVKGNEP